MHSMLEPLRDAGWIIEPAMLGSTLPVEIVRRHPRLPAEVCQVLSGIACCVSPDEGAWLFGVRDYASTGDAAFAWNEFETMSLDAAGEDAAERERIQRFWDEHLPVFMSVRDGYEYAAVRVAEPGLGTIVRGREPCFEEAEGVAGDFSEFIKGLAAGA